MNPKDALARAALSRIPKLLTLQDRTPTSPTYGCFDRNYWHYRMMDFPCGMSQEFVLPLALAWVEEMPDNPYFQRDAIRQWAIAGIRYAARSAHGDGSCDDYFPFERAAGATAFSLYACLRAAELLGVRDDPEISRFLEHRAQWLAGHRESGRLSNHEALIVACLARMQVWQGERWQSVLLERAGRLKSWQHEEGWFDEYGGADPGYLSLTIGLLAETDRLIPDLGLREPCRRAIDFLACVAHPDGTIGGEYCSRATRNYFPHGLEIAGEWYPEALGLGSQLARPIVEGRDPCYDDDHIVGHHMWSRMLAWKEWHDDRPDVVKPASGDLDFAGARISIRSAGEYRLYCGWSKGGAYRLFHGDRFVQADTGPAIGMEDGKVAVAHLDGSRLESGTSDETIAVEGELAWAKSSRLTPFRSIVLRALMLSFGRFFPNLIRKALQRLLVTGSKPAPFNNHRRLDLSAEGLRVRDEIVPSQGWQRAKTLGFGAHQSSVTTIMSRVWQPDQFAFWTDASDRLDAATDNNPIIIERMIDVSERAS